MTPDDLVSGLGTLLGLPELQFDDQGGMGLDLPNGLELGLRRSGDGTEILVFAVLRVVDDPELEAPGLLRANLLGERTAGACLSIGEDADGRDCLVLWRSFVVAVIDVQSFADALARFAETASLWREGEQPVADTSDKQERPAILPEIGAAFGLRV